VKIDSICICCYKGDFYLTRILVASIRFWYPEIDVYLIKDKSCGDFDTSELEEAWNVKPFPTRQSNFGIGFGKLEPLFLPPGRRFLVLDSDILFIGPVLESLEAHDEQFLIHKEELESGSPELRRHYFNLERLAAIDPSFRYPGFVFNSGQMVVSSGVLSYADFEPFVSGKPLRVRSPDVFFKTGEQGVLVYVLLKGLQEKRLSLAHVPMMLWAPTQEVARLQLNQIAATSPYRCMIHWAGMRRLRLRKMIRGDILMHFEDFYYTKVSRGTYKRTQRRFERAIHDLARELRIKGRNVLARTES
jgi:hypothetical protein